jgi:outer membrane protein OmpA-like peptidoglycan-associated protein
MKTSLASILLCIASTAVAGPDFKSRTPRGTSLTASPGTSELMPQDDVVFAHNSSAISESAIAQLDSAARWLRARPGLRVLVEGYTDHLGVAVYNEDLATRRAQAVRMMLMARGVPSDRIVIAVYGEAIADPAGNPLDRRVVLHASNLSVASIVAASLGRKQALSAMWTQGKAAFVETRGTQSIRAVATR